MRAAAGRSSAETSCSWRVERPTEDLSSSEVPSATLRPWSMTAIRSASWSASSRYCVVSRTVLPCSHELADRGPHLAAGPRVEAGGRLVEEDQRGSGDQAGGQVETPPHAAGELRDLLGRRPPRARTARAGWPPVSRAAGRLRPCRRPNRSRFSVAVRFSSTEAYCPVTPRSWRTTCGLARTSTPKMLGVARRRSGAGWRAS